MPAARERFKAWRGDRPQGEVAAELGITQGLVSAIERGEKTPGLRTAVAIEAATAELDGGPILAAEWLEGAGEDGAA